MESSNSADGRPGKRARTGELDIERTVVRSTDLWLDDGNIILRAQAGTTTLYKVHKSTLALHCTSFKELFAGPQTVFDTASERYDGIPVMDMHDDAKDVHDFLKALYLPRLTHRRLWFDGQPRNFPGMYAGVLRLATKYDASAVRQFIVDAIKDAWPTTLRGWNRRQEDIERERWDFPKGLWQGFGDLPVECYPDPAQTIRLATDHDIPEVLPIAYYDLLRVFETQGPADECYRHADLSLLNQDELYRVIIGRGLLNACVRYSCSQSGNGGPPCERKDLYSCLFLVNMGWTKRKHILHEDPLGAVSEEDLESQPYDEDRDPDYVDESVAGVCDSCKHALVCRMAEVQRNVWRKLPDFFDLRELVGDNWGTV